MDAESYIVRVYRRGPEGLTGLVERVGTEERLAFRSAPELWAILYGQPNDGLQTPKPDEHKRR